MWCSLFDCKERDKIPGTMPEKKYGSQSNQIINPKRDRREWNEHTLRGKCTSFVVSIQFK
jgi:hypothetical protein